jgi:hypothetical protein
MGIAAYCPAIISDVRRDEWRRWLVDEEIL